MKRKVLFIAFLSAGLLSFAGSTAAAHFGDRSLGIGIRAGQWALPGPASHIAVQYANGTSSFDINGFGGSFYLIKRINPSLSMELSFSGFASVEGEAETHDYAGWSGDYHRRYDRQSRENFDGTAISPILLGFRYSLWPVRGATGLQPYVSAGVGPYIMTDFQHVDDGVFVTETAHTHAKTGGYLGGGVDLPLTSWMAVNCDIRYHLVDFRADHAYSNTEYALGLQFMWGRL